jgi:hypothetical protein
LLTLRCCYDVAIHSRSFIFYKFVTKFKDKGQDYNANSRHKDKMQIKVRVQGARPLCEAAKVVFKVSCKKSTNDFTRHPVKRPYSLILRTLGVAAKIIREDAA